MAVIVERAKRARVRARTNTYGKANHDAGEVAHALSLGADQHLAAQQVEGLNAGVPSYRGGDARVASDLLHPVLMNVAVSANTCMPRLRLPGPFRSESL